jgi:hypothetical protein
MALHKGSPVRRFHSSVVSRWLVIPMAAPDFLRVVFDPAGPGEDLAEFLLRDRHDTTLRVEHDAA